MYPRKALIRPTHEKSQSIVDFILGFEGDWSSLVDASRGQRIGEVSKKTGLSVQTLRQYEQTGVMPEAERSDTGHRHYNNASIERLQLISLLREGGFSLDEIKSVIETLMSNRKPGKENMALLNSKLKTVETKLNKLEALKTVFKKAVSR